MMPAFLVTFFQVKKVTTEDYKHDRFLVLLIIIRTARNN